MQQEQKSSFDQEEVKPDYSFLSDYTAPATKKRDPKIIVLVTLVVVTVLVAVVGSIFLPDNSANKQSSLAPDSEAVTKNFIDLIAQQDYQGAKQLYTQPESLPDEDYLFFWRDFMAKIYNFNSCEYDSQEPNLVAVSCARVDGLESAEVIYFSIDNQKITAVTDEASSQDD